MDITEETKIRLKDMAWLLNDLTCDLRTPVDLMFQLRPIMENNKQNFMSISRLCITSLIINLCRLKEIIDHYGVEIRSFPENLKTSLYDIKSKIESKDMYSFRSKYVAHAFSKEKGRQPKPLTLDQNIKAMMKIVDLGLDPVTENIFEFCKWVHTKDDLTSIVYITYSAVTHIEKIVGGLGCRR